MDKLQMALLALTLLVAPGAGLAHECPDDEGRSANPVLRHECPDDEERVFDFGLRHECPDDDERVGGSVLRHECPDDDERVAKPGVLDLFSLRL